MGACSDLLGIDIGVLEPFHLDYSPGIELGADLFQDPVRAPLFTNPDTRLDGVRFTSDASSPPGFVSVFRTQGRSW